MTEIIHPTVYHLDAVIASLVSADFRSWLPDWDVHQKSLQPPSSSHPCCSRLPGYCETLLHPALSTLTSSPQVQAWTQEGEASQPEIPETRSQSKSPPPHLSWAGELMAVNPSAWKAEAGESLQFCDILGYSVRY